MSVSLKQTTSSMSDCSDRVADLEKQLAAATRERDECLRDIEYLSLQVGEADVFSGSTVLSERIHGAESELAACREELVRVRAERDSLREDIANFRIAKRIADQSYAEEKRKCEELDRQLVCCRSQFAQAVGDRDNAELQADSFRASVVDFQARLKEAESRLAAESSQRHSLESQLKDCRAEIDVLRDKMQELQVIPELRGQLQASSQTIRAQQHTITDLQADGARKDEAIIDQGRELERHKERALALEGELSEERSRSASSRRELEEKRQAAETEAERWRAEAEASSQAEAKLRAQVEGVQQQMQEAQARAGAAESRVGSGEGGGEAVMENGHAAEAEVGHLRRELEAAQDTVESLRAEVMELARAKMDVLTQLSDAHSNANASNNMVQMLTEQSNGYKTKLAEATTQKVEALMEIASLKSQLAALEKKATADGEVARV